jgi:glycosyltransferase involved in cell wall biosynthesis
MIRILHVLGGLDRGGAETMVMNLYRVVDRTQIQFDFIVHNEKKQAYTDEILSFGGKIFHFPAFNCLNYLKMKNLWKKFFKEHPEYKILHSHVRSYASLYLPIAKKAGLKTIIHSHSTSNGKGISSIVKQIMQYPLRWQADYFFGCSKEAGEWLFGNKVVNSQKYHILQNAIDSEQYKFNPEIRREYRKKLGLGDKKTFIHVGRFHPAKNHPFLLNVFAKIHKLNSNTVLLLAGDGELRPEIEKQIVSLNLQNDVILLGSRNDVPKLLQTADCFLFPSVWEGLGMVAIEAQAAGLPCICSDAIPRTVKVTNHCIFLPTSNAQKWAEQALHWANQIDSSCNSVLSVVEHGFDIRESSKRLIEFYQANWGSV